MNHDNINPPNRNTKEQEQAIRINQLRAELNRLSGGQMIEGELENCPPDLKEQFLRNVLAFEQADQTTLQRVLAKRGCDFPAPDTLTDQDVIITMWELIDALAEIRVFLDFTDHLSDRELYTHLWHVSLREEDVFEPIDANAAWHFDLTGARAEDEIQVYLRYYADEAFRESWARQYPEDVLPPMENPPYDRDRHMPKPWGSNEEG